ncbi:radical SAM family heme chaperone HemW [Agaribacterium sp. ZY112]|uniref:radical SAM family heme chaperone HemW n=1 Tax=Agaribacterium sp. ZY112 TaxID=3233574 RepID=UPI003524263D
MKLPPLSLYIHIPWCIQKCPYCDFNSHQQRGELPATAYVDALLEDLQHDLSYVQGRSIKSVFFGGGTPSLMPAEELKRLLSKIQEQLIFEDDCEITLEANPGTAEYSNFDLLLQAGINRLSFGAQSFNDLQLQKLGRIHNSDEITFAVNKAQAAGFNNINIDLMHSLPGQTVNEALADIEAAIALKPQHLSWYQLTIEPNTAFYSQPPVLPNDEQSAAIYEAGIELLENKAYKQYEVSAYTQPSKESKHNLNYWRFGDYLAIGAGAHGKISQKDGQILRFQKTRQPQAYLDSQGSRSSKVAPITQTELALEFMMNALRLKQGVEAQLFTERTGLPWTEIEKQVQHLKKIGLLENKVNQLQCSDTGQRWLNDILSHFMVA